MKQMKVRDIIRLADAMLGTDIDQRVFVKEQMDDELFDAVKSDRTLQKLVGCVNLALCELAEEYLPLTARQTVTAGGIVPYADFERSPVQILSARQGGNVRYVYRPDGVEFEAEGDVEVEYTYRPGERGFLDEVETGGGQIGVRTLAYAVCAEYCLQNGDYDEAQVWDKRYKDNLLNALSKKSEISIKKREWR